MLQIKIKATATMDTTEEGYSKMLELQRLAFEKQFGTLESLGYEDKTKTETETELQSNRSSTSGSDASSDEDDEEDEKYYTDTDDASEAGPDSEDDAQQHVKQPRVIKFNGPSDTYVPPTRHEIKQLRTGRPLKTHPDENAHKRKTENPSGNASDEEDNEAENLKNDLELQRFLKESHLLNAFDSNSYDDDTIVGKARSRTLEMRLKTISATNGRHQKLNKLEKVPINIRKGMINKHMKKIAQHEQEARDGGVVLSHIKKGEFRKIDATYKNDIERRIGTTIKKQHHSDRKNRQRGLKINTVGQSTRNGLIISKHDIERINGGSNHKKSRR